MLDLTGAGEASSGEEVLNKIRKFVLSAISYL
jgi:hypothetical protein